MDEVEKDRLLRVYRKVDEIKKYRMFVATVLFIAAYMLDLLWFLYTQNVSQMTLWVMASPLFVFGIILLTEYLRVIDRNPFLGKHWEERKIKRILDKEQMQWNKWQ